MVGNVKTRLLSIPRAAGLVLVPFLAGVRGPGKSGQR